MSKILIVEDEESIAELEKDYLELSGFEVEIENDGEAGLKRAISEEFDLFILDLMLPGVDGFEICKEIRNHKNTPILMVSAKKDDIDKIRGLGLGADDYMTKPFSPSELVARVKAHMARYERLVSTNMPKNDIVEIRGIKIDKTAHTGVEGLYACGEATGGMHGADRIGGLSSANGIVFGRIAGASAALTAQKEPEAALKTDITLPQYGIATTDADRLTHSLRHTMSTYCMINRTETGLSEALQQLESLQDKAMALSKPHADDSEIAALARLQSQIQLSTEMVKAMRKRTESLGSHYRAD